MEKQEQIKRECLYKSRGHVLTLQQMVEDMWRDPTAVSKVSLAVPLNLSREITFHLTVLMVLKALEGDYEGSAIHMDFSDPWLRGVPR